ncbi:MAG: 50S ribosome-binding GTPase [Firmicutes bacterium]|nr:50S ribosome-binding GTPase [Bacillota bacterium]
MEIIGGAIGIMILVGVIVWLIYLLFVHIIIPALWIILRVILGAGLIYAFFTSLWSFQDAFRQHKNPYETYVDKSPNATAGIKRSYFFGPGYHRIKMTVNQAFLNQQEWLTKLKDFRDNHTATDSIFEWCITVPLWIFYFMAMFATIVLGYVWIGLFSALFASVLTTGMLLFYLYFTTLLGVDRLILAVKAIQSRCGNCKRVSVVPNFVCPNCGMYHKKLIPSPYGILTRRCSCGKRLSTTYFNGRSAYTPICAFCEHELAASDAQQFGIQLVGGPTTGKTTFLAAFCHEYLKKAKKTPNLTIKTTPQLDFDELEYFYQSGNNDATTEKNATMYSLIHQYGEKTPIQMTIYDIAGEAFSDLSTDILQQQFRYCEGIIFVVDTTADSESVSAVINNFINEFSALKGKKTAKISDVPVAIIITKSDLHNREIGLPKIRSNFVNRKYLDENGNTSHEFTRNIMCKNYLIELGFSNTINMIFATFNRVQFFSVSAIGHSEVGKKYEPWGVLEPVEWLFNKEEL